MKAFELSGENVAVVALLMFAAMVEGEEDRGIDDVDLIGSGDCIGENG